MHFFNPIIQIHHRKTIRLIGTALFSLAVSYALIRFALPPLGKYRAELREKTKTDGVFLWYHDLDGDGHSERIRCSRGNVYATHITVDSRGKALGQWNLAEELVPFHPAFGDYDRNGLAEVYVFTVRNDSLFGNRFEPYGENAAVSSRFLASVHRKNGKTDFGVIPCGFFDGDKDGYEEYALLVNAGFALQPRSVFVWDIRNDTVYSSPRSAAAIRQPVVFDLDGDGRQEILVQSSATGNYPDSSSVPFSDRFCWLMAFNDRAEFLFRPVKMGAFPSHVKVAPYSTGNKFCIAALYSYTGVDNRKCSIGLYSEEGQALRERKLGVYDEKLQNARLFSPDPSGSRRLFLAYGNGDVEELDSALAVINSRNVPGVYAGLHEYRGGAMDIDKDSERELLFCGKEEMIITRSDFSHPVSISMPADGETRYTAILHGKGAPELFIAGEKNARKFSYGLNPLYPFKYAAYTGMYGIVFMIAFLLQRFYLRWKQIVRESFPIPASGAGSEGAIPAMPSDGSLLRTQINKVRFNTRSGYILAEPDSIIYCEASDNYSFLHYVTGKKDIVSLNLKTVQEMLPLKDFCRIHRSHLINLNYLEAFSKQNRSCTLKNPEGLLIELKVSAALIKELKNALSARLLSPEKVPASPAR